MTVPDAPAPDTAGTHFEDVLAARLSRRGALQVGLVASAAAVAAGTVLGRAGAAAAQSAEGAVAGATTAGGAAARNGGPAPLSFTSIPSIDATVDGETVAANYRSDVLIRWGDPIRPNTPAWSVDTQSSAAQARQFGFNCDFISYHPLRTGPNDEFGVLFVNHEYTYGIQMFPNYPASGSGLDTLATGSAAQRAQLKEWVDIELAAHGCSVVAIERRGLAGQWRYLPNHRLNRRITATTPCELTGPAAKDVRVNPTAARRVLVPGVLNNCAGGVTPWGTVLTAEENFNQYFANANTCADPGARANHARYGIPTGASPRRWERVYDRFDTAKMPYEPMKYGFLVEVDPTNPNDVPKKRTALGRFKHEAAACSIGRDGRVAVYSGDDERDNYWFKFVTRRRFNRTSKAANRDLLDEGTLYVAQFNADGSGRWIPLDFAADPAFWMSKGFTGQADICLRTREAGDAVGATRMDRPEDADVNPTKPGHVILVMTNNSSRRTDRSVSEPTRPNVAGEVAANPRWNATSGNRAGHIIELIEGYEDSSQSWFRWEIFMLCGDPTAPDAPPILASVAGVTPGVNNQTYFAGWTGPVSPIGAPDNTAFDSSGNLLIATDGAPSAIGKNDGLHMVAIEGPNRGELKQLYAAPAGAEVCGPTLTADDTTLFLAIQHPGEDGAITDGNPANNPQSRWPDSLIGGAPAVPRPSVVAVRRVDGGRVGS
jgi:secreted PhoX family phosphatase